MQWLYGFHKFIILVSPTAIKLGAKAFTTSDYARHDIFTGHTKRIAAGNPYARLNDPRATTTGLVPSVASRAPASSWPRPPAGGEPGPSCATSPLLAFALQAASTHEKAATRPNAICGNGGRSDWNG